MVTWWLVLIACLVATLIVGVSVYMVVIFAAEADRGMAWFPKAVVVFGFALSACIVLLLPLDVANRREPVTMSHYGGGLDLTVAWQVLLWTAAVTIVVIIPFATFYYENYDPEDHYNYAQQCGPAVLYTFILLVVFTILLVILWLTVGQAVIPYYSYTAQPQFVGAFDGRLAYTNAKVAAKLELKVSFFVYTLGLLCALGWFLFCIYAGVGLVSLPAELVDAFKNHPRPISATEFVALKTKIGREAERLQVEGKRLQQSSRQAKLFHVLTGNAFQRNVNRHRRRVLRLQRAYDRAFVSYEERGVGPIKLCGIGILALCAFGLSIAWILHVLLYNLPRELSRSKTPPTPFLNGLLVSLDKAFTLLGTLAYALFAFYLLIATVRGCFKIGLRIVFFRVHPMKLGDTLMNALLFNCGLVLLTSIVVMQFTAMSFQDYATDTVVDGMVNLYARRLKGLGAIMFYLQFVLLVVVFLTFCLIAFWGVRPCKKQRRRSDGSLIADGSESEDSELASDDDGGCCTSCF
jgi:LMBR1 domain-containing protein 1